MRKTPHGVFSPPFSSARSTKLITVSLSSGGILFTLDNIHGFVDTTFYTIRSTSNCWIWALTASGGALMFTLKNVCVNLLSSKTATLHQSQPRVLSRVFLSVGGSSTIRGCSATTRLPGVSSEEELASGCVSTSITHLWLQLNRDLFQEPHRGLHLSIGLISSSSCQPIWVVLCLPLLPL